MILRKLLCLNKWLFRRIIIYFQYFYLFCKRENFFFIHFICLFILILFAYLFMFDDDCCILIISQCYCEMVNKF